MSEKSPGKINRSARNWSLTTIFLNCILAVGKGVAGIFGNSSALIADAIESTSDIFASALIYAGMRYAHKPPDEDHPYGHGRIESVTTFAIVGFLLVSAGIIIFNSIENILQEQSVPETYTLYVLIGVIIIKEIFYRISKNYGEKANSSSLIADAEHHRSDAITSAAAFLGISIAIIFGEKFAEADEWAAIIAAGIIIYNAYKLFRPTYSEIMDEQSYPELEGEIRELSIKIDGVIETEKCYIRKMGIRYYVDLHIIVHGDKSVRKGHAIAHELKKLLLEELSELDNVLIHVEPEEELSKLSD